MARGQHLGKIIVSLCDPADVEVRPPARDGAVIASDRSVLITGGLGGLGLSVAEWLCERGAQHLVLMGRGAPSADASVRIGQLEACGVDVEVVQADVADYDALSMALDSRAKTPIGGIIHAAGILDDATIANLVPDQLIRVSRPKVAGSWNLHRWSEGRELDFFVLFSSAATLLGSPGQANYCAANAFMDGLAAFRSSRGLPALSVAWGTVSDVGLAAAQSNRGARLEARGLRAISPGEVNEALGLLIGLPFAHLGVMRFDAREWTDGNPGAARSGLFARLLQGDAGDSDNASSAREELMQIEDPGERVAQLDTVVREQVGKVLRIAPSRVASQVPLGDIGLDSLMSVELRNRLEALFAVALPATTLFNYPTVSDLVPYLAAKMSLEIEEGSDASEHAAPEASEDLADRSADELAALLEDELVRHEQQKDA